MDSVTLNEKEYVKVSTIAKSFGYTRDYIGQLCRGEKVDAVLIGRSWYVNPESLRGHKQGRYRSSLSATKKDIEKNRDSLLNNRTTDRDMTNNIDISYERDNQDINISLADASDRNESKIKVKIDSGDVTVESEDVEQIAVFEKPKERKLTGGLSVVEATEGKPEKDMRVVSESVRAQDVSIYFEREMSESKMDRVLSFEDKLSVLPKNLEDDAVYSNIPENTSSLGGFKIILGSLVIGVLVSFVLYSTTWRLEYAKNMENESYIFSANAFYSL